MYDLILGIAKSDVRIKAAYMNGSRTNENVPKDIFQDYALQHIQDDKLCKILLDKESILPEIEAATDCQLLLC